MLFAALLLGVSFTALAQLKEGKIIYERTVSFQLPPQGAGAPPPPPNMPRSRTDQYELLFSKDKALFQFLPTAANEEPGTFSAPGMVIRMGGTNDIIYSDLASGLTTSKLELMDREFLVGDTIRKLSWKISSETKTILNYTARKAVALRVQTRPRMTMENGEMKRQMITDSVEVVAWFTTDIPVSVGPGESQGQLPGAVLELSTNRGNMVYKAVEIKPNINLAHIKEPKGGKKLTQAEFVVEREKLFEEMRANSPAGGGRTIRMN